MHNSHAESHMFFRHAYYLVWLLALVSANAASGQSLPQSKDALRLRRPVAAVLVDEGRTLALANSRSGSVSLVDVDAGQVTGEYIVGLRLSSLAVVSGDRYLLATDESRHELIVLAREEEGLRAAARVATAPFPVSVTVSADGKRAVVASLWSHCLQIIDISRLAALSSGAKPSLLHNVPLPIAPRLLLSLPKSSQVVVTDSFGGGLAVVDIERGQLAATHDIAAHNIRGLALSAEGKELLISHQTLDQKRPITQLAVEKGTIIQNIVRRIPLAQLVSGKLDSPNANNTIELDDDWIHGAADPAGIALWNGKNLAVALAGNNMVAVLDERFQVERRLNVGARPTVLLREPRRGDLICVNMLSDSVSVVDLAGDRLPREISLGPRPTQTSRDRGETLFYDGVLSPHGWYSCHSCHTDGHTNGLLADTSGDDSHGAPKRTLTLLGASLTDRWAWSGEVPDLHTQVRKSLHTTMHGSWFAPENVLEIVDYLHTLAPPPPREPARTDAADREQLARGRALFTDRGCVKCHVAPLTYTSPDAYDVGLADELGRKKFNPPSLRGVSQGRRFFHDSRASSLEAVFTEHGHGLDADLSRGEMADLLRFLRSL